MGILGVGQDITAQKQAQDIIKRDKKMLEALVEERTDQLLKAQEEIEASKRLRDLGRIEKNSSPLRTSRFPQTLCR